MSALKKESMKVSELARRLSCYGSGASTVALVGASVASAAPIGFDYNPDIVLDRNNGVGSGINYLDIDLNQDGHNDVRAANVFSYGFSTRPFSFLNFLDGYSPSSPLAAVNDNPAFNYAAVLASGTSVGPLTTNIGVPVAPYGNHYGNLAYFNGSVPEGPFGPWTGVSDAYAGLRLTVAGQPHFAWIRMGVSNVAGSLAITLKSWAYETSANTAITTGGAFTPIPEPTSLGLMALGAAGLMMHRRRKA